MSSLSEKMISEFVESTMPAKEERSHEFTINGTVTSVDHNGVANVMLDGGDETPCQTTVGCSAGDRVIVSFKNREPVVTSNISKPTATLEEVNAKVVNAVNVFAETGTFVGKVDITWHPGDGIDYATNVVIGQNSYRTQNLYPGISVKEVNGEQGGYTVVAAAETTYYATNTVLSTLNVTGYGIFIAEDSKWAQLTVDGVRTSSDARLKEDIVKIDPATAKHLRPVQFRFKGDDKLHYGFIAQEVAPIFPDAVAADKNGYLSLLYLELLAPTLALAQENAKQIESLKAELEELRKEVKILGETKDNSVPT